jgi:hypothetical protein
MSAGMTSSVFGRPSLLSPVSVSRQPDRARFTPQDPVNRAGISSMKRMSAPSAGRFRSGFETPAADRLDRRFRQVVVRAESFRKPAGADRQLRCLGASFAAMQNHQIRGD